jgi:hypothetical protein
MDWKLLLLNRFSLTIGGLVLCAALWNVYVSGHDNGYVSGYVVDQNGRPVADATVSLSRKTVSSVDSVAETRTGPSGEFTFSDHGQYALLLSASKAEAEAPRKTFRLWFRNQDLVLSEPLVLMR